MCTPLTAEHPFSAPSREEVKDVYDAPLLELVFAAARVHRMYHDPRQARARQARRVASSPARGRLCVAC